MQRIGYGRHNIDDSDLAAVISVLKSEALTCGPWIERFEAELCKATGAKHAIALANGTSALRLMYRAAGIGPGKRVGVPAITFVATAMQAQALGAEIVLLDVDPQSGLLTPEILDRCTERLDAVTCVHYAGALCDTEALAKICAKRGTMLFEDAAHSLGSSMGTLQSGDCKHSRAAILSFHPVKTITTGEGGAVTTNDADLAARIRSLRHHGIERKNLTGPLAKTDAGAPWYHEFHTISGNDRLPDINCALGVSQLARLQTFKTARAAIRERYLQELASESWIRIWDCPKQTPCWHLVAALINFAMIGKSRRNLISFLAARGIDCQVHYIPLHCQPILATAIRASDLSGAMQFYQAELSLPCHPGLSASDQTRVIDALKAFRSQP